MTMPPGFLGTDADLLMDLLVVVVPGIMLMMCASWVQARRRRWRSHRNIQVTLATVLAVAVGALELHIAQSGGIAGILGGVPGPSLELMLNVHLVFAFTASVTWIGLVVSSLIKFANPPVPNAFSGRHKLVGRVGMGAMFGTASTSVGVYWLAFLI